MDMEHCRFTISDTFWAMKTNLDRTIKGDTIGRDENDGHLGAIIYIIIGIPK